MNNIITTIETTAKNSIEPIPKFFNDKTIDILDEDSIINILSFLEFKDLVQCRRLNKRFLQVINDNLLVYKSFFKNYCFQPKQFLSLPQNFLLDIKQELNNKSMLLDQDYLNIYQDSINFREKLFFDLEKSLSRTKEIGYQEIKTIFHNNQITSTCFSKDNSLFVTISKIDGVVKIFNWVGNNYQLLNEVVHIEESGNIYDYKVLLSPDKSYMITSSSFLHIIWHATTTGDYRQVMSLKNLYSSDIFFRDDSKRLFLKVMHAPIRVFDLEDGKCECVLTLDIGQSNDVFNLRYGKFTDNAPLSKDLKNDNWLCFVIQRRAMSDIFGGIHEFGDADFAAEIKGMIDQKWRGIPEYEGLPVNSIVYSNDMNLIYVHNMRAISTILEYVNHKWQVKSKIAGADRFPSFSSDNQRFITGYSYGEKHLHTATIWNISGSKSYKEITLTDAISAKFSVDSRYVISCHIDSFIKIWHLTNGVWRLKSKISMQPRGKAFFGNYNWVIFGMIENTITIFKAHNYSNEKPESKYLVDNKKIILTGEKEIKDAENIYFATGNKYLVTTNTNEAKLWGNNTDKTTPTAILKHEETITNILFSPDNSHFVVASDFLTSIWVTNKGQCNKIITIKTREKPMLSFKEDGTKLIVATLNDTIRIFKLEDKKWIEDLVIKNITEEFYLQQNKFMLKPSFKYGDNDSWLNSALQTYAITAIANNKIKEQSIYENSMFLPESRNGLFNQEQQPQTKSFVHTVKDIIYARDHKAHSIFGLPNSSIIAYSSNNKLIYLGFKTGSSVILENNDSKWSKKLVFYVKADKIFFSPDNRRLITMSSMSDTNTIGKMLVWNIESDTPYQEISLDNITSANFSPDGMHLLTTSSDDNKVKIWGLSNDERWELQDSIINDTTPKFASFSADSQIISIVLANQTIKLVNNYVA